MQYSFTSTQGDQGAQILIYLMDFPLTFFSGVALHSRNNLSNQHNQSLKLKAHFDHE